MKALLRLVARRWLPLTLGLLAAVTVLSLTPVPGGEGGVAARTDKLQHLVAYAALGAPLALARPPRWLWLLGGLAAWSAAIERVQPLVGRGAHLEDFAANVTGLALGALAAALLRRVAARRP